MERIDKIVVAACERWSHMSCLAPETRNEIKRPNPFTLEILTWNIRTACELPKALKGTKQNFVQ